jgi:hypothetical protein
MGEPRIKDNISWNRDALRTSFELFECPDMSAQSSKNVFQNRRATGAFLDQAGRPGPAQPVLVARARRAVAIQRSVQGRIRACRSF